MVFSAGARTDPLVRWIHSHRVVTLWSRKPACRILKQMETMKTLRIFSMAALVLVMAACTSSDIEIPQQDGKIHFTAKIAAPNSGSATKTVYTVNGTTINVAWRAKEEGVYEGDKIALIHNGEKDIATVTAVDGSGNATIEATISGTPQDGDDVVLVYPAASVDATGSGTDFEPKAEYLALGLNQNGTLKYIQDNLDGRQGSGKLSVSGGTASLKGSVKMDSKIAIWKLNLTSDGTTAINAKTVTLNLGNQAIAGGADDSGKSEYYICVVPATLAAIYAAATAASLPTPAFTIVANDGTDTYTYTKDSPLTLANNGYYQSTVTLAKETPYDATVNIADGAVIVPAHEHWLIQGDGTKVNNTITIGDNATVTLRNVYIIAQNNTNAIKCEGNANIVLKGTNTLQSTDSGSGTITITSAVIQAGTYAPKTTLTISGDGILNASPSFPSSATTKVHDGAVIGANSGGDCGNIVINSGTIIVSTDYGAGAGIGAGRVGANDSKCGTITIAGGTVSATSNLGAGIGTGTHNTGAAGTSMCDGITISGGTVTARSYDGAAIGSGKESGGSNQYNSHSNCGNILITGGTIDARSTHTGDVYAGAAIGSGFNSTAGTITISGGKIKAIGGGKAAAIGSGGYGGKCSAISITGGEIEASGGYQGAGIGTGTGNANNNKSTCGKIEITSGVTKVTASNGRNTSTLYKSIGRGYGSTTASCGEVWIGGSKTGEISTNPYTYQP